MSDSDEEMEMPVVQTRLPQRKPPKPPTSNPKPPVPRRVTETTPTKPKPAMPRVQTTTMEAIKRKPRTPEVRKNKPLNKDTLVRYYFEMTTNNCHDLIIGIS